MSGGTGLAVSRAAPTGGVLSSALGCDGRLVRPGDRVAYTLREGLWVVGSIVRLEWSGDGEPVARLRTSAPGLAGSTSVPASSCLGLSRRR